MHEKLKFLLVAISWCARLNFVCCQWLLEALIILFRVTGLCVATTLSIVHLSLDVHIKSILILINSLTNPLLINKKMLIQGGIEVYARSGDSATRNGDYDTGNGHQR